MGKQADTRLVDYIVVGGGSAGCVLANRLSEDPGVTVCLLEAGPSDTHPTIHVPAGMLWLMRSKVLNWQFNTEPESQLAGRQLYWPRGRMLGGSSSMNAMCHTPRHPTDSHTVGAQGNAGPDQGGKKDTSDLVKKQAEKSLAAIKAIAGDTGSGAAAVSTSSVYVDIGPMSSKTTDAANNDKLRALMKKTIEKTFGVKGKDLALTWPGGKVPTRKDLDGKKVAGFHVDGTLTDLIVKEKGSAATVSCKVSMLIASFPEKSVFGFLSGGASVTASTDATDIRLAGEDCVSAVIEDLVAKKIIPTIKIKAGL